VVATIRIEEQICSVLQGNWALIVAATRIGGDQMIAETEEKNDSQESRKESR